MPWSEELVVKYEDKWNWESLSNNKGIKWSFNLLNKYVDRVHWSWILSQKNLTWSIENIKKYLKYIAYDDFGDDHFYSSAIEPIINNRIVENIMKTIIDIEYIEAKIPKFKNWYDICSLSKIGKVYFPDSLFCHFTFGVAAIESNIRCWGIYQDAIISLKKCIENKYNKMTSLLFLGKISIEKYGTNEEGCTFLDQISIKKIDHNKIKKKHIDIITTRAILYTKIRSYVKSINDYSYIIELIDKIGKIKAAELLNSRHIGYYYDKRAQCKIEINQIDSAIADWEQALLLGYDNNNIKEKIKRFL